VGSREPSPGTPIDAAAFRQVILATIGNRPFEAAAVPDAALGSAAGIGPDTAFVELGQSEASVAARVIAKVPSVPSAWSWKPPRFSLTGWASFYDYGTTAMRDVPRGTTIVICGAAGCIQRIVNDYGPSKAGGRLIDMYRPDFFKICGCGWWSGTTWVTVKVY
jgi:hypothetical protein